MKALQNLASADWDKKLGEAEGPLISPRVVSRDSRPTGRGFTIGK